MQVRQRLVVSHQAGVVRHLGIASTDLGSQQIVQCLGARVEDLDLELPYPLLGGGTSVQVRTGGSFVSRQLLYRVSQLVTDLRFLGVQHRSSLRHPQLEIPDLSVRRSHSDRQCELES